MHNGQPNQSDQPDNPASNGHTKHPPGNNFGLKQAYDIRDLAAKQALELADCHPTTVQELAARAQALRNNTAVWETAAERIRIMRGRPLPGSLKPVKAPKSTHRRPAEPL